MRRTLIFILRVYQAFLSPLMPGGCKFYPSCSHYAVEAVETHGALRGAWLAGLRVLRCRPLARGGFDPVPACSCRGESSDSPVPVNAVRADASRADLKIGPYAESAR